MDGRQLAVRLTHTAIETPHFAALSTAEPDYSAGALSRKLCGWFVEAWFAEAWSVQVFSSANPKMNTGIMKLEYSGIDQSC